MDNIKKSNILEVYRIVQNINNWKNVEKFIKSINIKLQPILNCRKFKESTEMKDTEESEDLKQRND